MNLKEISCCNYPAFAGELALVIVDFEGGVAKIESGRGHMDQRLMDGWKPVNLVSRIIFHELSYIHTFKSIRSCQI